MHLYQAHGEAGITKKYTSFSPSEKVEILQYMWANQLSYMQTAAHFNVRSRRGRPKKMPELPPQQPKAPPDDDTRTREELLAEVNYLRMENAYLKKLKALVQRQQAAAPKKRR